VKLKKRLELHLQVQVLLEPSLEPEHLLAARLARLRARKVHSALLQQQGLMVRSQQSVWGLSMLAVPRVLLAHLADS
jgi:hypothetical protein